MKNDLQKADILHIDMKKDFQINLKKDHHSIIRRYNHAFLFWKVFTQSLIIEFLDQNLCMLTKTKWDRLHRRFEHFSIRRFYQILDRSNHDVEFQIIDHFTKFCHHCQAFEKFSSRFSFTLKDDLKFNYNVIMNILYIEIKNINKSILHLVDEINRFQANK